MVKKSKYHKLISCLLVLVMLMSLIPAPVFAAGGDIPYEGTHKASIVVTVRDAITGDPIEGASVLLEDITAGRYHNYGTRNTNGSGQASWAELSSGTYRVTEVQVPEGYKLDGSPRTFYLDSTGDKVQYDVQFLNRSEVALYIYRIDPETNTGLAGAEYTVTDSQGHTVASGPTDEHGRFVVKHLPAGDYTVTEVKAPDGYTLSPRPQKIRIQDSSDEPFQVIFDGQEESSITIFNYDISTGEPIAGSKWKITKANGDFVQAGLTTGPDGMVTVSGLAPGTYIVQQTAVVKGYVQTLQSAEVVVRDETVNVVVSLPNTPLGSITVYVGDSVSGTALGGVQFSLYDKDGKLVAGPKVSDSTGYVTFEDVPDGVYNVKAVTPDGYEIPGSSQKVTVQNGENVSSTFTATEQGSLQLKAISATGNKAIPGVTFEVRSMSGDLIGTYTTGADGTVLIPHLKTGYYTVTETNVPEGYVLESVSKNVYVQSGSTATSVFSHRDKPYIVVQTYITGTTTPIQGSVVTLYNENGVAIMNGTTGEDGTYTFLDLEPGAYTVRYSSAPEGYTIKVASQTVVVTTVKAGVATLYADRYSSIVISKLDDKTGDPLAGAIFMVRSANGVIEETVTTDHTGTAVTKILEPGRYTVHEMFAPEGYVPAMNFLTLTVSNDKTAQVTFTNEKKSAVVVYAYDNLGNPMEGVSYILQDAVTGMELATALTNEAGVATFEDIVPGDYIVSESIVPEGYIVTEQTQSRVLVVGDQASYVRFVHTPQAVIKMQTVDSETGEAIRGAVYMIEKIDGTSIGDFSTDANGEAVTGPLEQGTYYVKQIVAPDGYLLNTTTQTIEVYSDRENLAKFFNKPISRIKVETLVSGENFGLTGVTITVENEAGKEVAHGTTTADGTFITDQLEPGHYTVKVISTPEGYTCIQKERTVEVTTGLSTSVKFEFTKNSVIIVNLTDAEDPTHGLAGAKFRVELVGGDFATEIVTGSDGKAQTEPLPNGRYMVHQLTAPEGYILDQSYQWATVEAEANTVLDFTNHRISGLVIQALLESDHSGLAGATFEIWEQNGKLIKTVTTDSTGVLQVDGLASGVYLVKEVKVPDGYTSRQLTQTVTISMDLSTTITFYHTAESVLTVTKKDAKTGAVLAGAEFRITKANGDFVGDYTTDASGKIVVSTLEAGTYNIAETKAPEGYILDTTSKSFTIRDGQPVVLDLTNEPESGLRIINTCVHDGLPIAGNTFKITTYAGVYVGDYTTNAAGQINVGLEPGEYTIYQTYVADGYVKNETVWNVTIKAGENATLEVQNEKLSSILVHFIDKVTEADIFGVEIEVKDKNNNFVGRFKSDNEGRIDLTAVLTQGKYTLTILTVPNGYDKDTVPKTVSVEIGKTTEVLWKLQGHQGQLTIVTYSGEDSVMMNIRKNTILSGAVYQITDTTGKVVGTITGNVNGLAYSGALGLGTYYVQQIVAPVGWQVNATRFAVNVTSLNDNIRVEVYNKAANYKTSVSVHGQASAMAGANVKYYFNLSNDSTSAMDNFYLHIKIPTDAMRAVTLYTGTYAGTACVYSVEYKTNMGDYRVLASGLNSKSSYSYGLSTQSLGLQAGEYVTDVRLVFNTVVAGFKDSMPPTVTCYTLSTLMYGTNAIMRAEVGAINGYYSNNSNGGTWGNTTGQTLFSNASANGAGQAGAAAVAGNGWVSSAGQFTTYVYGYYRNVLPYQLPKTGY